MLLKKQLTTVLKRNSFKETARSTFPKSRTKTGLLRLKKSRNFYDLGLQVSLLMQKLLPMKSIDKLFGCHFCFVLALRFYLLLKRFNKVELIPY